MKLSRDAIQRMVDGRGNSGGTGGGGGEGAGGASQAWVGQNFVSIEFFSRLIKAYAAGATSSDPDVEIVPNDVESTVKNIKMMAGVWTEQYVSALGQGTGGSGSATSLADLVDVQINTSTLAQGQALLYDGNGHWYNGTVQGGGGISMTDVWTALATADNTKQIDYSHLSGAISINNGTITIGSQSITPLTGNYLPLTGGTLSNVNNVLNIASSNEHSWIYFLSTKNGALVNRGSVGYYNNLAFVANEATYARIGVADDGTPQYWPDASGYTKYTLIHTGNREQFDGTLSIFPGSNQNWREGIRIHSATNGWSTLILCGPDNTGDSGTSANSWSMHSYGGDFYLNRNGSNTPETYLLCNVGGNWGIGTNSPSYKLHVSGSMGVSGTGTFGNVLSNGYVTALSDVRLKNVLGHVELTAEKIAKASAIRFSWKDGHDKREHVGGIAQEWQELLPQAVVDVDGRLSMDYSAIAYVSVVSLAKMVVVQQREIDSLKAENAKLEKRLERLEKMFAITGEEDE